MEQGAHVAIHQEHPIQYETVFPLSYSIHYPNVMYDVCVENVGNGDKGCREKGEGGLATNGVVGVRGVAPERY